jgi:L-seryl-tRNA(Ser) seleniumtransferase
LRLLARTYDGIKTQAERLKPAIARILGDHFLVDVCNCESQVGSGALPVDTIPSAGLIVRCRSNSVLDRLIAALRGLPNPVIGRVVDNALLLDFRCLEREEAFLSSLSALAIAPLS